MKTKLLLVLGLFITSLCVVSCSDDEVIPEPEQPTIVSLS